MDGGGSRRQPPHSWAGARPDTPQSTAACRTVHTPPCSRTNFFRLGIRPNWGCPSDASCDRRDGGGGSTEPEPTVLWGVEDCGGAEVPGEGGPVGRRGPSSGGEGDRPATGRQSWGCAGEIQGGAGFLEGREKSVATCTLSQVGFAPPYRKCTLGTNFQFWFRSRNFTDPGSEICSHLTPEDTLISSMCRGLYAIFGYTKFCQWIRTDTCRSDCYTRHFEMNAEQKNNCTSSFLIGLISNEKQTWPVLMKLCPSIERIGFYVAKVSWLWLRSGFARRYIFMLLPPLCCAAVHKAMRYIFMTRYSSYLLPPVDHSIIKKSNLIFDAYCSSHT